MHSIVVATSDEELRSRVVDHLAASGRAATCCASWSDTLAKTAWDGTRLVLVDGDLEGASGPLLDALRKSVPHKPELRVIRGSLPPIQPLRALGQLDQMAGMVEAMFTDRETRLLDLIGIGAEPMVLLQKLAASPLPVRFQGERGTGKEWVARMAHRMAAGERPFVVLYPGDEPLVRDSGPGTLFLENIDLHRHESIQGILSLAAATGWRIMAGSRHPPDSKREGLGWTHVLVRPLRERPKDIRPLARMYLDDYRRRLGLPQRRVQAALWEVIERYPWPGNHRELETFVVQAATSARGALLSTQTVPRRVLALLDPLERDRGDRRAFEELVEARLRPVVARYEPSPDAPSLYAIVIDATERALLRVALGRTAGNQKAAAELLGLARNTLRERMQRLDPFNEET